MDGSKAHASLRSFFPEADDVQCAGDGLWAIVNTGGERQQAHCPGCWYEKIDRGVEAFTPPRFRLRIAIPAAVAAWVSRGNGAEGLYLTGQVGTGKTHTAWSALAAWCSETGTIPHGTRSNDWEMRVAPNVIFTRMTDLLDDLRPGDESRQRIRDCQHAGLLVIDDLGAEKASEWTQERFYSVIDHRYANRLPLIVTSNLPAKAKGMSSQVGDRAASRLAEMCAVVSMTGSDRRRPS